MRVLSFILLFLGAAFYANSQFLKYSNEFLSLGVGARNLGLSGSVVSTIDDANSSYWNPAGLTRITDNLQITAMHNEQFAGISKHDFGAISLKLNDNSAAAVSFIRLGVDDIPNTLYLMQDGQINYSLIKNFSAVDYAFSGSYATKTKIENLRIGGTVKIIRRIVGDFGGAWGFGADLGAQYNITKWNFGIIARDVTSTFNAWTWNLSEQDKQQLLLAGNKLPEGGLEITTPTFTGGASYLFQFKDETFSILPELNFDISTDGQRNVLLSSKYINVNPRLGLELGYKNFVFIRSGIGNIQKVKDFNGIKSFNIMPSIGAGLKLQNLSIDYALGNAFNEGLLGMSNIISLRLNINKKS